MINRTVSLQRNVKTNFFTSKSNLKIQLIIKAYKRCRRVKDGVKQNAVEYSNGDIHWIDKEILKYGEAQDLLWRYLNKLNTQSNKKNKRGRHIKL